ncbi:hypothetical protein F4775DRAFT_597301 [Biscogniauxia sp. FL1348]|nr:hypothetical protein F4775DRAFT_597301 [Biscogniauxia sp. FL1348]
MARLICKFDDGTMLNMQAEINWVLPDYKGFLHVEHLIRDPLAEFKGQEHRYAKSHVATRGLDSRTRATVRVALIHLSVYSGKKVAFQSYHDNLGIRYFSESCGIATANGSLWP